MHYLVFVLQSVLSEELLISLNFVNLHQLADVEKFMFSFHAAPGLLVSPVESSSGSSSTSPSSAASSFAYASLANVIPNTVTSTEGFPPTPSSVYSHPANLQWNERMADFRLQRVPAL
jgi:hypothetical protein